MFQFPTRFCALIFATGVLLPAQQAVWFTPLPYGAQAVGAFGSTDYMSLFSATAPWQQAASHVQVFKIYGVSNFSDTDLANMIANLKSRNIALALEWPVLSSSTCGIGIEGFGNSLLPTVQRIQALGGTLSYLAMEQPYQWGSLYQGADGCQWTAEQVAQNALVEVNQAKSVFPDLLVGDITAIPSFPYLGTDWPALYGTWFDTWRTVTGAPLAFFHADVNWTEPNWQAAVAAIRPVVEQHGIPFGMVYNGFLTDESDAAWIAAAESHFVDYEVSSGYAPPEQVNFQSWNPNPTHVLPETDPTAFTYLIDRYFRTRTNLTVANDGSQISGTLSAAGNPVAGASVQLTAQALSGNGSVAIYTISGSVPTEARAAVVGARINTECYSCNAASDLTVYSFQYSDNTGATGAWNFSQGLTGWSFGPGAALFSYGPAPYGEGLEITAQPGQAVELSSIPMVITPGTQFTLRVTARVAPVSVGSGYFTLIWLDSTGNEPSREIIMFEPQTQVLTTATTLADGSFSAGSSVDPTQYQVTAQYAGSSTQWPSSATVPANPAPSSAPTVVSLTPARVSGASANFSAVFSDPNGWAAIANAEMLINTGPFPQGGCNVGYLPASKTFQLLNDAGSAWSSTVLSNSQCSLSGASASGTGNNLTLAFTLNFTASFGSTAPQNTIFLQVIDSQGPMAPWQAAGVWSVPPTIIQTNPAGLQFSVDGQAAQTAPQSLNLSTGAHTVSVTSPQAGTPGTQYAFAGWSDSGAASHTITVTDTSTTYTANFDTQYQLTTVALPGSGGAVTPATQFYDAGSQIQVSATASSPYQFLGWTGAASGTGIAAVVTLNGPASVNAFFGVPGFTCSVVTGALTPSVTDVQQIVREALGMASPIDDLNGDHALNVADVQKVIDAATGFGCIY